MMNGGDLPKVLVLRVANRKVPAFESIADQRFETTEMAFAEDSVRSMALSAFEAIFVVLLDESDLDAAGTRRILEILCRHDRVVVCVTVKPLQAIDATPFLELGCADVFTSDVPPQFMLHRARQILDKNRANHELQRMRRRLENTERRYEDLVKYSLNAIAHYSLKGVPLRVNDAWYKLWGFYGEDALNFFFNQYNLIEDKQLKEVMHGLKKVIAGEAVSLPTILYHGTVNKPEPMYFSRWVEAFAYPNRDDNGDLSEIVVVQLDVTEDIHSEQTLKLLSETSKLLTTSLDLRQTMNAIAELAVRDIGDVCSISLLDCAHEAQEFTLLGKAKVESGKVEPYIRGLNPLLRSYFSPNHRGTSDGQEYLYIPVLGREEEHIQDKGLKDALADLLEIGARSLLAVPIKKNEAILGLVCVLAFDRCFNEKDLELLTEISTRAAFAVNNARLYAEAKKAIQIRDDFIAAASHELRTPVTALLLHNQFMQNVLNDSHGAPMPLEKLRMMTGISERHITSLGVMVETLLDATRLSSGTIKMKPKPFELTSFIGDIIKKHAFMVEQAKCELKFVAAEPVHGEWDPLRIEQIFFNLLSNALKYGAGREVVVEVGKTESQAFIKVRDRGIGIDKHDLERIFRPYERSVSIREYRGLGLGLYIALQMIKLHQGTIEVDSKLGEGSTFCVRLPLRVSEGTQAA